MKEKIVDFLKHGMIGETMFFFADDTVETQYTGEHSWSINPKSHLAESIYQFTIKQSHFEDNEEEIDFNEWADQIMEAKQQKELNEVRGN